MGLVILTDHNTLKKDEDVEVSEDCIVCQFNKEDQAINDVERIFQTLEAARSAGKDLSKLDEEMCDYHAKKARGLKIVVHDDHLMEIDPSTVSANPNRIADARTITKEEYEQQAEIEDGETEM